METRALLDGLGYTSSPNCLQGEALEHAPDFGHVFRRAMKPAVGLEAVYCLRQAADPGQPGVVRQLVPITYVCRAATLDDAEQIHRLVWNQNVAPFVVVLAPQGVRLYSGFEFGGRRAASDHRKCLAESDLAGAVEQLRSLSLSAESIDSAAVWNRWGAEIRPERRVAWRLLDDLQKLEEQLVQAGLDDRTLAHALIGKYVYLHYLRDREILSERRLAEWDLSRPQVFGRSAGLRQFSRLCGLLDTWLNGSIFPLEAREIERIGEAALQQVAGVFAGDSPSGQLHFDFPAYDFAHIPIETLSVIYEQFLHATPRETGKNAGEHQAAYYTPVPVANFIIDRMEEFHPLRPPMRVCDFSCGSGTFLVQCYRKLIEDRLRSQSDAPRPRPTELRQLLVDHIFGVDVDAEACRVAQLSLLLTLLDYVEPPDLTNTTFKLPDLSAGNVVQANAFDDRNDFVASARRKGFDWIIGNPPWKDLGAKTKDAIHKPVLDWMLAHKNDKPTGGNQTAEAFAWRSIDFAHDGGLAGLLMPAMTLFKSESEAFRQRFFSENELAYVANFANLAEVLFAGRSRVPAAAIVFQPGQRPTAANGPRRIPVFSPLVANQEPTRPRIARRRVESWSVVVDEGEVRPIELREIRRGEALTWKLTAWGSHLDAAILRRTEQLPDLHALASRAGLVVSEGLQLRRKPKKPHEPLEHHPELAGQPMLVTKQLARLDHFLAFPASAIRPVEEDETYVREGRFDLPESVCRPPHVIVSAARNWVIFTDEYLIVPPRQIGIAGNAGQSKLLKALALYLNSDFVHYQQFFVSTQSGVQRQVGTLDALRTAPVPQDLVDSCGPTIDTWAELYDQLVTHERLDPRALGVSESDARNAALLSELNRRVGAALQLHRTEAVRVSDFVHVILGLRDGKVEERAVRAPTPNECGTYAKTLKRELDTFIGDTGDIKHAVQVWSDDQQGVIQLDLSAHDGTVTVHPRTRGKDVLRQVAEIRAQLQRHFSQWRYFNRSLRIFAENRLYLFKPMQRFHWLESQAVLDAGEVIGLVLDQKRATQ